MKKQALLFFALLLCASAYPQGVRYDVPPILNSRAVLVPNANISLCPGTATITNSTCSPASTQAFTDITLTTPCATGSPVVLPQTNVCSGVADALGNAGFWLAPGAYIYCINGPTITGKCYNLTVPSGATTGGGLTVTSVNGAVYVDGIKNTTIAQAITQAGSGGTVIVPPNCASSTVAPATVTISFPINLIVQCNVTSSASPNISILASGTVITGSGSDSTPSQNSTAVTWTNSGSGFTIQYGDGVNGYRGLVIEKLNFTATTPAVANNIKIKANATDTSFRDLVLTGLGFDASDGNQQLMRYERVRVNRAVNIAFNINCSGQVGCNSISFQSTYADATSGTGTGYDFGNINATLNATDADSGVCGYKWEGGGGQVVSVGSDDEANSTAGWCISGAGGNITLVSAKGGAEVLPISITGSAAVTIINPFTTSTSGANSINVTAGGTGQNLLVADSGLDKPITVASGGVLQRMGSLTNLQGPLTLLNVNTGPGITVPIDTISIAAGLRISDTHAAGCNWDFGEIFNVGTLDLRATSCGGGGLAVNPNAGSNRAILTFTNTADRIIQFPNGASATVMPAALVTTAATTDNVAITGMTSTGHCTLTATNTAAATNIATTFISAKTTNQITVTHTATGSMNYDILCTPN